MNKEQKTILSGSSTGGREKSPICILQTAEI